MGNGAGEAMSKLSMKGVLIGAIVDVITSLLLGVPLAIYAMSNSPWRNYRNCASGDEMCGTGKRVPPSGDKSGDLVAR